MAIKRLQQIRFRIGLAIMLTAALVLVATFAVALIQQASYFKSYKQAHYVSTAKILGAHSQVAINFDDRDAVDELLRSVKSDKNLKSVMVYNAEGEVFGSRKFINNNDPISKFIDEKPFSIRDLEQIFRLNKISDLMGARYVEFHDELLSLSRYGSMTNI